MTKTHSPGPWHIEIGQIDKSWLKGRLQEAIWSGGEAVAICSDNLANARLIAAAPDLLRALELMLNSDMAQREEDEGNISTVLSHARAAVAKAKGES